jgi:starch phosphorylase
MAHLATVGSHAVNGVARLHSELLRTSVLRDFHDLWPEKFSNKTNGVTPRRFVALDNPRLTALISSEIGDGWLSSLDRLRELEPRAADPRFQEAWRRVKSENKRELALEIRRRTGIEVDPESLFDVQVKRIHEYKRQHLNVLRVISLYLEILETGGKGRTPRTVIFAGKAAPGYVLAKLIIKLVNSVAEVVNRDSTTSPFLRVVFLPDYNVKNSRRIFPAADLSEQISTAGMEASGTGNMKLGLNGALTIATYDGANIEIREEVGPENFFLFGLTADEGARRSAEGYRPRDHYESDARLRAALDLISSGFFSRGDRSLFRPLVDSLLERDPYMVCADFASYVACQDEVARAYLDPEGWTRMSILNVSRMGKFSSDRAIAEYCRDIWNVEPVVNDKRSGR